MPGVPLGGYRRYFIGEDCANHFTLDLIVVRCSGSMGVYEPDLGGVKLSLGKCIPDRLL